MDNRVQTVIKHPAFAPTISGVVSLGVGLAVGYLLGRRRVAEPYEVPEDVIDVSKIRASRNQFSIVDDDCRDAETYGDGTAVEDDGPKITEEQKRAMMPVDENITITIAEHVEEEEPKDPIRRTIFAQDSSDWNMAQELASRYKGQPYVLHHDEFYEENEEFDYPQVTYTWYEGDMIMVDQEDEIVPNWEEIVGPLKFGHGAKDPNVFHIRNEKRRIEIEVLRSMDYYARAVVGLDIEEEAEQELRHSFTPKMRRME